MVRERELLKRVLRWFDKSSYSLALVDDIRACLEAEEPPSALIKIADVDNEHIKIEILFTPPLKNQPLPLSHLMAMQAVEAINKDSSDGALH